MLDSWLKQRALKNEQGASRTYVVTEEQSDVVIAYYALAVGAILHEDAVENVRKGMPKPVPAILLGRLAVDRRWQGRGLGAGLLKDAVIRSLRLAEQVGVRALFLHALDDEAADFYKKWGFDPSPVDPLMLMITLEDARLSIA